MEHRNKMDAKQEEVLKEAFQQWRQHPTTGMLVANIQRLRQKCTDLISGLATDPGVPDAAIRYQAVNVKNTDAILKMINDYDTFCSMINQPK